MKNFKKIYCILFSMLMVFLISCNTPGKKNSNIENLKVYFINVGQGDSMLIAYKDINILIDAGPKYNSKNLIGFLKSQGVKKLDYVIATHPHEDHIGAMEDIIKKFKIEKFYAPKVLTNTESFKKMIYELKKNNLKIHVAKEGVIIEFDNNTYIEFLSPTKDKYENLNNYSAVVLLHHGNNSFLFTGDAEKIVERELLSKYSNLKAEVLKAAHHGSNTSSTEEFIEAVNPKIAVISCGLGNDFGHPNEQVLKTFISRGITLYRTYTEGTILLQSDGKRISRLVAYIDIKNRLVYDN